MKSEANMGLMSTVAIGAAGYWLYRSGRLNPYIQQVKDSPYLQQVKDSPYLQQIMGKAGLGSAPPATRANQQAAESSAAAPDTLPPAI
jgi:hypothetical protein